MNHLLDVESGQLLDLLLQSGSWINFDLLCDEVCILFEERLDVQVRLPDELRVRVVMVW